MTHRCRLSEEGHVPHRVAPLRARILVVDDSEPFRILIDRALGREYELSFAEDEKSALEAIARANLHLVLLDLHLPPDTGSARVGLSLLASFRQSHPKLRVIVVSGTNERRDAIQAIASGASDFYTKPIALEELRVVIKRNLQVVELEQENERLAAEMRSRDGAERGQLIGSSPSFQQAVQLLNRVAPTDATVLLLGENGTGKEVFARALHQRSRRSRGPFVAINCGAIPESLAESELFGFVKGAFTGAVRDRMGRIEAADGGTLFLDEIGELSAHLQAKLLRFVQERQIEPLGGNRTVEVDVRIIAATNRDLKQMVEEGAFREDLYYRLNVIQTYLPPLRERREDVVPLAQYFLRLNRELAGDREVRFSEAARRWLESYAFPGNVRELENVVKRALLLANGNEIGPEDFQSSSAPVETSSARPGAPPSAAPTLPESLSGAVEAAERRAIEAALRLEAGNVSRAATRLEVERKSLQRLIKRLDIDTARFSPEGRIRRGRPSGSDTPQTK